MFRLLGGGVMGDMGKPLPPSRLAVLPATSHTAVITQVELLHAFVEPFLKGETPKGLLRIAAAPAAFMLDFAEHEVNSEASS
jgi:hypothetical protein